ncbi:MAG TPA: lipopolysaccharide kinase InaA family protein [Gemmatimonadaceae bacterium]|nr:lipopolysaccharide kinase InaA family protein [Gemmatimonadaceae bacterium]
MTSAGALPPGYRRLADGRVRAVGLASLAAPLESALAAGPFYDYAASHPEARELRGRGVAYAVPLPDGETPVVVRRSRRGGLIAAITADRFVGATRAPRELDIATRLASLGVPTPEVVAYATYRAGPGLRRADVVTREVPRARDLAVALRAAGSAEKRRELLVATAILLDALGTAGARHPDLNLRNVLISRDESGRAVAFALDVDRIRFHRPGDPAVTTANIRRLVRSARKLARTEALPIGEPELEMLISAVRAQPRPGA